MAIGNAQENINKDKLKIYFGNLLVAKNGCVNEEYIENLAAKYLENNEVLIKVDVGEGNSSFTVWTCDFTEEYIRINSDYRS